MKGSLPISPIPNTQKRLQIPDNQKESFISIHKLSILTQIHTRPCDFEGIIPAVRFFDSKIGSKRENFGDTRTDGQTQAFQIDRHGK